MPIYEYRCAKCGYECDSVFPVGRARKSVHCQGCNGRAVRVYSAPSIRFIGSGFHNTDYRKGAKPETKEKPTPQETKAKANASKNSASDKST